MTPQEIFDAVATHLLKQGRAAMDEQGRCVYRGPNGTRCAAGAVIPDELYDPAMENSPIDDVLAMYPRLAVAVGTDVDTVSLLIELQEVHDNLANCRSPEFNDGALRDHLKIVALDNGLAYDVLKEEESA